MGDPNDGIRWLMQCGIWDLFDPDIEGTVKDSCTHMLLSPFFSSSPQQRKTRATRHAHITSPFHRVHTSLLGEGGRRSGLGFAPPRSALAARIRCETYRSLIVASRSSVKRNARTELAPHSSGTSTATSSLG